MFKRIDHVEIVPADMERTVDFYTRVLGFTVKERRKIESPAFNEIAYLTLGDTVVELLGVKGPVPATAQPGQVSYRMIALEVEDMDKAVEYLRGQGVAITRGSVGIGKAKRAEITDPNGLPIELRQW